MTAIEILERIRRLDIEIDAKKEQIFHLQELIGSIGEIYPKNELENIIVQTEKLKHKLYNDVGEMLDLKATACEIIANLDDADHRIILEYRYLTGMTWEKIAQKMNCCSVHTYRIHKAALAALEKMIFNTVKILPRR